MARLLMPPPKFAHSEWVISNQIKYANAEAERAASERLIEDSKRIIDDTAKTTFKTQRDVNKKFDQRLDDIVTWQKEVDDKLDDIKKETNSLDVYRARIAKALEDCKEPLYISQQCLVNRRRRIGIDLVHDEPERELLKEVEVTQGVMAILERSVEQAVEQLRLNRKAKYNLEKDLKGKFAARTIDGASAELRNNSHGIFLKPGVAKIDVKSVTPDEWEDFSNINILEGEKQRHNSEALRSLLDAILQQTANDMIRQKERTDQAFERRIAETRDAKEKLQAHLNKVFKQITEVEDGISNLEKAINEKEAPLKVAHTRLENRSHRPNVELCRDAVQYRLVTEVAEINDSVARLQQKLDQLHNALKALTRKQLELEDEINIKANTLFIDETECQTLRKSINIQPF